MGGEGQQHGGGALDDGQKYEILQLIRSELKDCPAGNETLKEVEHLKKAVNNMEEVDNRIFEKIDRQNKEIGDKLDGNKTTLSEKIEEMGKEFIKKIDGFYKLLLTVLLSGAGSLLIAVVVFLLNNGHKLIK